MAGRRNDFDSINNVANLAVVVHEGAEAIIGDVDELEVLAVHDRHVHVVCRGAELLKLLGSENVNRNKMHLGMAVLSGLKRTSFIDKDGKDEDQKDSRD